jgi:hypothetical protein
METVAMQAPLGEMVTFQDVNFIYEAQGLINFIHLPASTPENFEPREARRLHVGMMATLIQYSLSHSEIGLQ